MDINLLKIHPFSNDELYFMQKGILLLIENANRAKKLLNDDRIAGKEIEEYLTQLNMLLVKIGSCET